MCQFCRCSPREDFRTSAGGELRASTTLSWSAEKLLSSTEFISSPSSIVGDVGVSPLGSTRFSDAQMSGDGSWHSSEFNFGVSSSSEMDSESFERAKVEEEQAAVSSSHSIRALLRVSSVATSMGDPGNRIWKGGGEMLVEFQRM